MSHVIIVTQYGEHIRLPRQTAFDMYHDAMTADSSDAEREQCASVLYGINQGYAVVNEGWNY